MSTAKSPRTRGAKIAAVVVGIVAIVSVSTGAAIAMSQGVSQRRVANDALTRRVLGELQSYTQWLAANHARGSISEFGWPAEDADKWSALADKWYDVADAASLWTLQFTTGAYGQYGQAPYDMLVYRQQARSDGGSALAVAGPQASILEEHSSSRAYRRGIVVSGGDWTDLDSRPSHRTFSNKSPGTYGGDWGSGGWRYESQASYRYLKGRGIDTVGINFRWERLQPVLFAPLDGDELDRLKATVAAAEDEGLRVILTLHNYGDYYQAPYGRVTVGDRRLPIEALADVWERISRVFANDPKVVAYTLMNEPHSLRAHVFVKGGRVISGARLWELISQMTLMAIRRTGDPKMILVPGYNYSHLDTWRREHPVGWITDPAHHFLYDAHQYWDADGSGQYRRSYDAENALFGHSGG